MGRFYSKGREVSEQSSNEYDLWFSSGFWRGKTVMEQNVEKQKTHSEVEGALAGRSTH